MHRSTRAAWAAPTAIESLESRRMLSATVEHGVLMIEGTRRADVIFVALDGARTLNVTVNGQQSSFDRRSVGKIRVVAGCGDDQVYVGAGRPLTARVQVLGGEGNDSLTGGAGDDTLRGEDGDDQLDGMGGSDLLQGGGGKDRLMGGDGDDQLSGDSGADQLWGGDGDDTLFGGRGDDTLHEDAGRDRVCGNDGADLFYFTDSPKDVRDETRGETIAAEPPIVITGPAYTGPRPRGNDLAGGIIKSGAGSITIGGGITGIGSIGSITGIGGSGGTSGGTSGGIIGSSGPSGGISGSGGVIGSVTISSGGGLNPGGSGVLPPSTPTVQPPVTFTVRELTFVFSDVPAGKTLFPTYGGIMVTTPAMLLERLRTVTVEGGGSLADGSTLDVPAGSTVTLADGSVLTVGAGSTNAVAGPLTLTTPAGNSVKINTSYSLTISAPAETDNAPTPP